MAVKVAVAGLDIGTSRVVAAVARSAAPGRSPVVGACPSLGVRKGVVVDVDGVARAVRQAVDLAARAAGVRVDAVHVGFSGQGVNVLTRRAEVPLGPQGRVTAGDVADALQMLRCADVPPGRIVLQVLPVEFSLDGVPFKGNPVGRRCSRLVLEARVITADSQLVERLIEGVTKAGLKAVEVIPGPVVAAEGVLRAAEKELGAALVDMGGGTTAVALFKGGALRDMAVIPVGGDHITADLAIGLRTSLGEAEEIKRGLGLEPRAGAGLAGEKGRDAGGVPVRAGTPFLAGDGLQAAGQIVAFRVQEILELVRETLGRLAGGPELPGGVVLCGGGSLLRGLAERAPGVLGLPVRVAQDPDVQAACWLARRAVKRAGLEGRRRQGIAAGIFAAFIT
ncbi:cell division protein FtsA [Desulfovirgula thermocuniculi]|uniref:cell division protein FtsA n=1 Tax=Desulfovirgula thermocuniculi TaxID=348842 RepID=UPI00042A8BA8|nr:cell division protein FtsA [Desulfovirgula thermocuniculi]